MPHELGVVDNWVHDALAAKSNLVLVVGDRIWEGEIPQGAPYPYCLYGMFSEHSVQGLGLVRLLSRPLMYAKLVWTGNVTDGIRSALDDLDDALGAVSVAVSEEYVISARRLNMLDYRERNPVGESVRHRGGLYRLEVSPSGA